VDCPLSPVDFAVAGLALDICGAVILVRGLFPSVTQILDRARTDLQIRPEDLTGGPFTSRFKLGHPTLLLGHVQDKADGAIGVLMFVLGFLLQASSAILSAAGVAGGTGAAAWLFACGVLLASLAVGAGLYCVVRRPLVERFLEAVPAKPEVDLHFADACRRLFRDPSSREPGVTSTRPFP
jgi:hypothetical protein